MQSFDGTVLGAQLSSTIAAGEQYITFTMWYETKGSTQVIRAVPTTRVYLDTNTTHDSRPGLKRRGPFACSLLR